MASNINNKSAGVGPSRRTWNKEEYTAKAAQRDAAFHSRRREELSKPTQTMQARSAPLHLDRHVGKALIVDASSTPGFFCALCSKTLKDSAAYLDHINGRLHLLRLGQSTHVSRATLHQVRNKIASLRAQLNPDRSTTSQAAQYDFEARIRILAQHEQQRRHQQRIQRKQQRKLSQNSLSHSQPPSSPPDAHLLLHAVGFTGFGSTKKR